MAIDIGNGNKRGPRVRGKPWVSPTLRLLQKECSKRFQLNNDSIRRHLGIQVLFIALTLALGFSDKANAETTAKECLKQTDSNLLVLPSPSGLGLLFSFESRVPAAFPVGTEEGKLKSWLSEEGFLNYGLGVADTAFADESDERARISSRVQAGKYVNLSILSWRTLCGRMVFSVGWHSDACGLIGEIYADVEYCQLDLP